MKSQGEILEGLVARVVSQDSSEQMNKVLKEFPPPPLDGRKFFIFKPENISSSFQRNNTYLDYYEMVMMVMFRSGEGCIPNFSLCKEIILCILMLTRHHPFLSCDKFLDDAI